MFKLPEIHPNLYEELDKSGFDNDYRMVMWYDQPKRMIIRFHTLMCCLSRMKIVLREDIRVNMFDWVKRLSRKDMVFGDRLNLEYENQKIGNNEDVTYNATVAAAAAV